MHQQEITQQQYLQQLQKQQQKQKQKQTPIYIQKQLHKAYQILSKPSPGNVEIRQAQQIINVVQKKQGILQIYFNLLEKYNLSNQTISKLILTHIYSYLKRQTNTRNDLSHDRYKINENFIKFYIYSNIDCKFKKMSQNAYCQFLFNQYSKYFYLQNKLQKDKKILQVTVNFIDQQFTKIYSVSVENLKLMTQYNKFTDPITLFIPVSNVVNDQTLKITYQMIHILKSLFLGGTLQINLMKKILPNFLSIYFVMIVDLIKKIVYSSQNNLQVQEQKLTLVCERFVQILLIGISKIDNGKFPAIRDKLLHTKQFMNLLVCLLSLSSFNNSPYILEILQQNVKSNNETTHQQLQNIIQKSNLKINLLNINIINLNQSKYNQINKSLINIKKYLLEILIKFSKYLKRKQTKEAQKYKYLISVFENLFIILKDKVIEKTQDYLKQTQSLQYIQLQNHSYLKEIQQFMANSIKLLSELARLKFNYTLTDKFKNEILFKIAFPWLISRKQHDRFSPQDYIYFREDIINKQNMSYIENSVANLIEAYLDQIDGSVVIIMNNSMNLISYNITNNINYLQKIAPELRKSWILQYYTAPRQIQSALTFLTLQSYLSLSRNDIVLELQKWLIQNKNFFFQINNDYKIIIQFLLMYSYYQDNFLNNIITGQTLILNDSRIFHKQILHYACYLIKNNYNYQNNNYPNKYSQIINIQALDLINNALNQILLFPALFYQFPQEQQFIFNQLLKKLSIKKTKSHIQEGIQDESKKENQQTKTSTYLIEYRKLGLNKSQYILQKDVLQIISFLLSHLQTRSNIKILEIFIEFLIQYIKFLYKQQGGFQNIPIIIRKEIPLQIAFKLYSLIQNQQIKISNRGLFQAKASQLLYISHLISIDAFKVYSLGLDSMWLNPSFWNFDSNQQDSNIQTLLKCTDIVVRLSLNKHILQGNELALMTLQKIAQVYSQYAYKYIIKIHKYNYLFGIFLNLILSKIKPTKIFDFLFILIRDYLFKKQLNQETEIFKDQQNDEQIHSENITSLLQLSLYLFLMNIQRSPEYLDTQTNFKLLNVFIVYLKHFINAHKIVTQLGDIFGKIFACCLCLIQKEYINGTLINYDKNNLNFLLRNILYSGKIYRTELQKKIVSIKLVNFIRQIIKQNDEFIGIQNITLMYQISSSCVYYLRNKDVLMDNYDDDEQYTDFDQQGQQQKWQSTVITLQKNDTNFYIQDQVLLLRNVSRQLLGSNELNIKNWIHNVIEGLPIAVKNFVKNKVLYYQEDFKQRKLRKIIKVKRPQNYSKQNINNMAIIKEKQFSEQSNLSTTKKGLIFANINKRNQKQENQDEIYNDSDYQ